MKRTVSTALLLFLLLFFGSCTIEKPSAIPSPPAEMNPVVVSVKLLKLKTITSTEGLYQFGVKFSLPMDKESVEESLHIFRATEDINEGVNPLKPSEEILTPPVDQRYAWSNDKKEVLVNAQLTEDSIYFLYISSMAKSEDGAYLDGRVGEDYNLDGVKDIFSLLPGEYVTANNDFYMGPSDFWSQPVIPSKRKNLKSYYYLLPSKADFYVSKIEEYEYGRTPGHEQYKFMGNTISSHDHDYKFSWPVKKDSLLRFTFDSDRAYSSGRNASIQPPPLLLKPETLQNVVVRDDEYRVISGAEFIYNDTPHHLVPVPLAGTIASFPSISPGDINPQMDYYVVMDLGKSIPSHTLSGTYLVIEDNDRGMKYVLPVTDNIGNEIKISPLYKVLRGRRRSNAGSFLDIDNYVMHSGELSGMLAYSISFGNKDNEVYRIQSNAGGYIFVNRVFGSGNNIMDCTTFPTEWCSIYVFFDGDKMNLSGKKAYITNNVFYLKLPSLEDGKKYFIEMGGYSFQQSIRDIWGIPLSDRSYDGIYKDGSGKAENRLVIGFATRVGSITSYPPTMRINDGTIYPYAVTGSECNGGICFAPDSYYNETITCGNERIKIKGYSEIFFSFYTPDGDQDNLYGYNDFLVDSSVNTQNIIVFSSDNKRRDYSLNTEIVMGREDDNRPGHGGFPTTLVRVKLLPSLLTCGSRSVSVPSIFQKGDKLFLSFRIEALTSNPHRKLDGNEDGIIEYDSEDDLWFKFNGEKFLREE